MPELWISFSHPPNPFVRPSVRSSRRGHWLPQSRWGQQSLAGTRTVTVIRIAGRVSGGRCPQPLHNSVLRTLGVDLADERRHGERYVGAPRTCISHRGDIACHCESALTCNRVGLFPYKATLAHVESCHRHRVRTYYYTRHGSVTRTTEKGRVPQV